MKTNQNMIRKMGNYNIIQRTEDGYFDANFLLHQWNKDIGNERRDMDKFLSSDKTKEFMTTIQERENPKSKK